MVVVVVVGCGVEAAGEGRVRRGILTELNSVRLSAEGKKRARAVMELELSLFLSIRS